jgi:SulP family sulfate permease
LRGPLFFGVAEHLLDLLQRTGPRPRAYVINLRQVPLVDATGAKTLADFAERCAHRGIVVYLAGLQPAVAATLREMHTLPHRNITAVESLGAAVELAGDAVSRGAAD